LRKATCVAGVSVGVYVAMGPLQSQTVSIDNAGCQSESRNETNISCFQPEFVVKVDFKNVTVVYRLLYSNGSVVEYIKYYFCIKYQISTKKYLVKVFKYSI